MLTFFDFISTIQGCSSMRHGVALLGHSFSKLQRVSNVQFEDAGVHTSTR
jgi:hypothetical protein